MTEGVYTSAERRAAGWRHLMPKIEIEAHAGPVFTDSAVRKAVVDETNVHRTHGNVRTAYEHVRRALELLQGKPGFEHIAHPQTHSVGVQVDRKIGASWGGHRVRFGIDGPLEYELDDGRRVIRRSPVHNAATAVHELAGHGMMAPDWIYLSHRGGAMAEPAVEVQEAYGDLRAAIAERRWQLGHAEYLPGGDVTMHRDLAFPANPSAGRRLAITIDEVDRMREAAAGAVDDGPLGRSAHAFDEHAASGVLSHSGFRIQRGIGGERGWQALDLLLDRSMETILGTEADLRQTAAVWKSAATELWGPDARETKIVLRALSRARL